MKEKNEFVKEHGLEVGEVILLYNDESMMIMIVGFTIGNVFTPSVSNMTTSKFKFDEDLKV